ncbi:hypothetical protein [Bacillus sp. REN10]|uniref:hypothetical protein n=1 Tax=Bacillus sp. REN10 TaxID=2782541 RepID=UPI00193BED91|nr:hypothetical protein [Bacillus sp. REN10]
MDSYKELFNTVLYFLDRDEKINEETNFYKLIPEYDLFPNDYLLFAEEELDLLVKNPENIRLKINCVLHLKRALNCQIDIFYNVFGFTKFLKKKNLGMDSKLHYLDELGLVKSRVMSRFNKIRNKVEHNYKIPSIADIEVYFDLIDSIITNLDKVIFKVGINAGQSREDFESERRFSIQYERSSIPTINFSVDNDSKVYNGNVSIDENRELFTKLFKLYLIINEQGNVKFRKSAIETLN